MAGDPISSPQNRYVRYVRSLYRKRARRREGSALIEGTLLVEEALKSGAEFLLVLYTPSAMERRRGRTVVEALRRGGVRTFMVTDALFEGLADTDSPQGVLAVVRCPVDSPDSIRLGENGIAVLAAGVRDPGNLGTIVRAADAAGAEAVIGGPGTVDFMNPKALRASMGSAFHLRLARADSYSQLESLFSEAKLVVADPRGEAELYSEDLGGRLVIAVGGETAGIDDELAKRANAVVRIPMPGRAESLNVAMAASIALYEAVRQRLVKPGSV